MRYDDQKADLVHKRKAGIRNSGRLRMYSTDLSSYVNHDLIAFDEKASGVLFIVSYCWFGSRLLVLYRPCWVHFGCSHARALHLFRAESSRPPNAKRASSGIQSSRCAWRAGRWVSAGVLCCMQELLGTRIGCN